MFTKSSFLLFTNFLKAFLVKFLCKIFSYPTFLQKENHSFFDQETMIEMQLQPNVQDVILSRPLLSEISTPSYKSSESSDEIQSIDYQEISFKISTVPSSSSCSQSYKQMAVLSGHVGSVSCLALCGEFILSASQGKDIIVWQQPDLRHFTKFGQGDGSVKALVTAGNRVFTAHQDSRIRVWKVSKRSENVIRLLDTLPTRKDYLGKFMKQRNYVPSRRNHKRLWIEHSDTISCLAVTNELIYSGSWDKTLKVWRISDFKCLESIEAHDDAINGLITSKGIVYSASSDGKIKAWVLNPRTNTHSLKGIMESHKDVSVNSVVASEDGRFVYGGCSDGYVMGWLGNNKCRDSWKSVCEVKAHEMSVLCLCIMREYMVSGSGDMSVCIWKKEKNGDLFKHMVIKGHEGPVKCIQASSRSVGDGFLLYSGSIDKSVRVWWVPNEITHKKFELE